MGRFFASFEPPKREVFWFSGLGACILEVAVETYERYAEVYDRVGQPRFSRKMASFTMGLLKRLGRGPQRLLDLACGTGEAAMLFAEAGHRVIGVDGSAAMVERAREKVASSDLPIAFLEQDMRTLRLDAPVDVVTCFFDSLNYLLQPEELQEVFFRVAAILAPGGLLVCDLNTTVGPALEWADRVYLAVDDEDLLGIHRMRPIRDGVVSEVQLTFFVRCGETWERFDEVHTQRGYDRAEVEPMMERAGLEVREALDETFSEPDPQAKRIIYVAVKGEQQAGRAQDATHDH